jgi:hypothetical protein
LLTLLLRVLMVLLRTLILSFNESFDFATNMMSQESSEFFLFAESKAPCNTDKALVEHPTSSVGASWPIQTLLLRRSGPSPSKIRPRPQPWVLSCEFFSLLFSYSCVAQKSDTILGS